jgi:predicted membrane protein
MKKRKKMLSVGILVILIGLLLIFLNMGLIPGEFRSILFSWQMLLIAIGVIQLFNRKFISGLILLIVGIFFITPHVVNIFPEVFKGVNPDFIHNFWPLLLVILGIIIVINALRPKSNNHMEFSREYTRSKETLGGTFDKNVVFSGSEYIVLEPIFSGGELNAVFGGIELDLSKTNLPEGDTVLEINSIFGGVSIIMPDNWDVETNLTCVMGGFNDQRNSNVEYLPGKRLIITGSCIFGGVDIK